MSQHLFIKPSSRPTLLVIATTLAFCLALLALFVSRRAVSPAPRIVPGLTATKENGEQIRAPRQLTAKAARSYLQQSGEGQSLMQSIMAARFGLKSQEQGPFRESGAGYLGMSHDQNLNAWFGEDGVTVRPTVAEQDRKHLWHMEMRLKGYGYGNQLVAAPPIVSHHVKDNRIEYERRVDCRLPTANCRFDGSMFAVGSTKSTLYEMHETRYGSAGLSQLAIGNRQSEITEWYENRAEGIEQGFTLSVRPERDSSVGTEEPLRLVVSLEGDLRAQARREGRAIELTDAAGKRALSYGALTALDAEGNQLAARMEANADGSEIALVVDDRKAVYPIVIDPIVASLEKILDRTLFAQDNAEFGYAVAIDGNRAIVGTWHEDSPVAVDSGIVSIFVRTGSTWTTDNSSAPGQNQNGAECGYSVAISGSKAVFGCPGANSGNGKAYVYDFNSRSVVELTASLTGGNLFGVSVGIYSSEIVVGAIGAGGNSGGVTFFRENSDGRTFSSLGTILGLPAESAAVDGNYAIAGLPRTGAGRAVIWTTEINSGIPDSTTNLAPSDGAPGDLFGLNVALSGNTAVIGAGGNDAKGTDAGAAYVFVRDANGQWSQQQKLTASDARAGDLFGYNAVAIQGNTIVVGALRQDFVVSNPNDNRGAAYIFTRRGTVWTQETKLTPSSFYRAAGDEFGTSVDISGDTVIVSAPHEAAASNGTANAGATYVYRLDCVPPYGTRAYSTSTDDATLIPDRIVCPGQNVTFSVVVTTSPGLIYQWRKNGVNIPGATSFSYLVNNASASDAGSYDVFVSNSCGGEFSTPATLAVHSFSLNSSSQNFGASGSTGFVNVTSTGGCGWTAVSNASWIRIDSGATGTGPGPSTVGFTVAANSGASRTGTITIAGRTFTATQDGVTPTQSVVQFSASNYSVNEDCTLVTITVNRIGDASGAASVDYATSDVTASERRDYTTALGKLRFAAGETAKSFSVLINEDSYVEGLESFNVTLSNPSGATLGTAVAIVQINDDPTEPASNSIDDPATFVGEHYHDFLNRQGDASGLAFWTNQITSCGTDQACIQLKRLNVSAAYFLSIEFQQTGYLVERVYKTAYGNGSGTSTFGGTHQLPVPIVRFREFLRDTQQIGQGVVVGQAGWEAVLESNKQAFTAGFVQLSRFTTAFPSSMTAAQVVDTLNANAGNPLTAAERNQLVNELATSAKTRAQVLRTIAEHPTLVTSESNRAFVLMQYFGYLRRNPNDSPDADYTGYDFWLTKLNQFSGNFVNAEMVKAFITSSEYRGRFGPQ